MMFFWIILLVGVIWAIWYFGKEGKKFPFENQKNEPVDILKRRFAKGEIEEEEYEERKAVLEEDEYLKYNP
ncbi:MAG: SHOCT domain-containing protein [Saprospiraceae bacterium]|jgi:putative membrane protein|nr:SHOCT domain-containing protein [Saprospiraceae bacterium]